MSKKILSLMLVLAMVFVFAACSSTPASQAPAEEPQAPAEEPQAPADEAPEAPAEEEPAGEEEAPAAPAGDVYTIKYMMYSTSTTDQDAVVEAAINEYIEPLINAHVDFTMVTGDPVWTEQVLTPLQAGEPMDIIFTPEWMKYMDNISKGLLLPLNDPNGPNGDLMNTYAPEAVENLGAFIPANIVNGFLYAFPTKKELCVPGGLMWNKDYVDKYNIDISTVQTMADMKPYLDQFIADPDNAGVYPLLDTGGWSHESPFIQGFVNNVETVVMRMGNPGEEQEPELYWSAPETKAYCQTMEEYMNAGYLDPDSYLTSFNNMDFLNTGKFMVTTDYVLKGGQVKANELMGSSGNANLHLVEFQTTVNNTSGNTNVCVTTHAGGSMLGIPVTSGNPVAAMQYINLMHMDPTLLNLMAWGVEGVHYNLDENGMVVPVENNGWSTAHGGMWTLGDQFKQLIAATEDPAKYDQMLELTANSWNHCSLGFRFDPTPVQNEITALNNVGDTYSRSMRTGVGVSASYDTMLQELEAAGVQTLLDEITKQYDAWKAENPTDPGAAWEVSKTE